MISAQHDNVITLQHDGIVQPRRAAVQNLFKTHVVTGLGVNANLKLG